MPEELLEENLVMEGPPPKKSGGRFKLPKGTRLMLLVALLALLAFGVSKCLHRESGDAASLKGVPTPNQEQASRVGLGNEEYNARIGQYSEEKTANAEKLGETWIPPMTGKPVVEEIKEEEKPEKPEAKPVPTSQPVRPTPVKVPRNNSQRVQKMTAWLERALTPPQLEAQSVMVLNKPSAVVIKPAGNIPADDGMPGYGPSNVPPMLKPGDILYAVNRITLDSDAPGPAMVEIVSGPYRGAKALGTFVRGGKHLTLQFGALSMPNGVTYSFTGYAIDPATDRTAIRSGVDNHYLARYGGLIASSFLSGFGDAVSQSGSSSYSNLYGGGYSIPNYDINEKLWIAAGDVGTRMADLFEKNWDLPPTVTLDSGTDIGILVISVGGNAGKAAVNAPGEPETRRAPKVLGVGQSSR